MASDPKETGMRSFTLRDFVEAGRERLRLDVVVGGDGLAHEVLEPMCNRPGLALTGFYGCFAWRRLQVIGRAEQAYLESLPSGESMARFKALFDRGAYCIIFANGRKIPDGLTEVAAAAGAVVMRTDLLTREFFHQSTFVLETLRAPTVRIYATTVEVEHFQGKTDLLAEASVKTRAMNLLKLLESQNQLLRIKNEINSKVKSEIDQQQREYYLNNQLKTIQEELGMDEMEDFAKPGASCPKTTWTCPTPRRCWTRTTTDWRKSKTASSSTWRC